MSLVAELLPEFEHKVDSITVVPSGGGVFEVHADDTLLYSKKATGSFPEYEDVAAPLRALLT